MIKIELLNSDQIDLYVEHLSRHLPEPGIDGIISQPSAHEPVDKAKIKTKTLERLSTQPGEGSWEVAWGLFDGDKIVGHLELVASPIKFLSHRAKLGMGIEQKYRSRGYGKLLLKAAIDWAKEQDFLSWIDLDVFAHNPVAIKLYRSFGFKPVGKIFDRIRVNQHRIDDLQFSLNLKSDRYWPEGYSIKECDSKEFSKAIDGQIERVFENDLILNVRDILSDLEKNKLKTLNENFKHPYQQHLLILHKGELAGWTWGFQDSRESFYMVNSAILPQHRRRGLYSLLLEVTLEKLIEKGFQRIWSRHNFTNTSIIVPKLKNGFHITGTELSDTFGALIHLTYFTNEIRRKVLDFRAGQLRPDKELKEIFKM